MSEGAETTGGAPVQTVTYTRARTLTELRLRVEARYIDAGVLNAFAATPENPTPKAVLAAVAKWLRDRLPAGMMLHDLRIFPTKPATRGWMGRVSVRSDLADRLLFSSGETGVFVTPKDRAGQICWLPDDASLEAAKKHAADNGGRLVANARGLGVCVPDARIRKTTLAILGAEAAGLKGCPVLVVEVPAGMDPSSLDLGEVLRDKRVRSKDGLCRRIWFRRPDAVEGKPMVVHVPRTDYQAADAKNEAPVPVQALPSQIPRKQRSYLSAAKRSQDPNTGEAVIKNRHDAIPSNAGAPGVTQRTVPGSELDHSAQDSKSRRKRDKKAEKKAATAEQALQDENADLRSRLDSLESIIRMLTQRLAVALPNDPAIAAAAAAIRPPQPPRTSSQQPDTPTTRQLREQLQEEAHEPVDVSMADDDQTTPLRVSRELAGTFPTPQRPDKDEEVSGPNKKGMHRGEEHIYAQPRTKEANRPQALSGKTKKRRGA